MSLQAAHFLRQKAALRCLSRLGDYHPGRPELFLQAFTHTSYTHEHPHLNLPSYQRLEFLGDAILSLYVADKLCTLFPDMREGELSLLRSSLVCRESLVEWGRFLGLEELILLGKGTSCSPSLLSDVFESLVGSIYRDCGYEGACSILDRLFDTYQRETGEALFHRHRVKLFAPKSRLQEITLKRYGETPQYRSHKIDEDYFQVELWIAGHRLSSACNPSKKEAEKTLAAKALEEKLYQNIPSKEAS